LASGEVHGLGHIPADRLREVQAVPGVTVHRQALARYTMLLINVRSPLFDRVETRQALEYAIDREALVEQGLKGEARPAHSPILPQSWAYDDAITPRPYDPAQARKLLDTAGWLMTDGGVRMRDGVTLTVVLAANSDVPSNVAVARQIERYLRDVGVDVQLALVSRESLLRNYLGPRAFHLVLASWEAQGADPDVYDYWHSSQASVKGGLNFSGWTNPDADRALEAARQTPDRATRARHYADFQRVFYQDVPAIILYSPLYAYATRRPATGAALPSYELLGPAYRFDTLRYWGLQADRLP
jgi:peptide/nickel transport system substrate-binding protein